MSNTSMVLLNGIQQMSKSLKLKFLKAFLFFLGSDWQDLSFWKKDNIRELNHTISNLSKCNHGKFTKFLTFSSITVRSLITLRFFWRLLMMQPEKNLWCVYLSFINKHVLQNNCLNTIWHDCHCNRFNKNVR